MARLRFARAGTPTTLKRSGSDYSATIFARLMAASRITMWKNVNGVYTADPRVVPEAYSIPELKYDEAIELAYFGAQVLHPSAMQPCIQGEIPIYVRDVFNPTLPGTVIEGRACSVTECKASPDDFTAGSPIKGITSINKVALLTVEGTGTSAVPDLVDRLFATLRNAGISTLMHTQASAESSICVVIEESEAQAATVSLEIAFERELQRGLVAGIVTEYGHSVVAIVGEGMAFRPGTGATFAKAMATAGINIRMIAQGSSERQISICVDAEDCSKALRAAHAALALSNTQISIAVLGGTGAVGGEFLDQLTESRKLLTDATDAGKRKAVSDLNIDFKLTAVSSSKAMRLSYDGIDPAGDVLADSQPANLNELTAFLEDDFNGNRIIIDCTASQEVRATPQPTLAVPNGTPAPLTVPHASPCCSTPGGRLLPEVAQRGHPRGCHQQEGGLRPRRALQPRKAGVPVAVVLQPRLLLRLTACRAWPLFRRPRWKPRRSGCTRRRHLAPGFPCWPPSRT